MGDNVKILLGSKKNINSVNSDNYINVELENKHSEIIEYNITKYVSSTDVFYDEREICEKYKIYGRIEYLSFLDGLKNNYDKLSDFFYHNDDDDCKNIYNSFKFYLVVPSTTEEYIRIGETNKYKRCFEVIATNDEFDIFPASFSNNVYGDKISGISFKSDIDVNGLFDYFGFPITEMFLYCEYIKNDVEETRYTTYNNGNLNYYKLLTVNYNIGDTLKNYNGDIIYDVVEYNSSQFYQNQVSGLTYYIKTPYNIENDTSHYYIVTPDNKREIEWKYNPLIPINLRYLDSEISTSKLNEIVSNSTSLVIFSNDEKIGDFNKISKQSISSELLNISKWDGVNESKSIITWNSLDGEVTFNSAGDYVLTFTTNIYLNPNNNSNVVETYLILNNEIVNDSTTRYDYNNNLIKSTVFVNVNANDVLKIGIKLVPNSDRVNIINVIPDYAYIDMNKGKYIWRNIVPQGMINNDGEGVNYPFLNNKRYLFFNEILSITPNYNDVDTKSVFNKLAYLLNSDTINNELLTELDNIDKPCQ